MTHFPGIRALAEFARALDDADQRAGHEVVWTDHLDLLSDAHVAEPTALAEVLEIIQQVLGSSTGDTVSSLERMTRVLCDTTVSTLRHGVPGDTAPVVALWNSFNGIQPGAVALDVDVPF